MFVLIAGIAASMMFSELPVPDRKNGNNDRGSYDKAKATSSIARLGTTEEVTQDLLKA